MTRPTTEIEKNVMTYLNDLRDSGVTNMFGASPYVVDEFGLNNKEARNLLVLWMENFNEEGNYENVKIR
jgi:hypothetical protein